MLTLIVSICLLSLPAIGEDLAAHWSFNETEGREVRETVSGNKDTIAGNYKYVPGVSGNALRFDGYTTSVTRRDAVAPRLDGPFTIEAWVALQSYPWTWCPIVDNEHDDQAGYYFGIDPEGRIGLHLAVGGFWQTTTSDLAVPLYKWNHLAGAFDPGGGIFLYLNGKLVRQLAIQGKPTFAQHTNLMIGRNNEPRPLAHAVRRPLPSSFSRPLPMPISLDGIVDELRIYRRALGAGELEQLWSRNRPVGPDPLFRPVLPSGPDGPGRFGAYYTRLQYLDAWEALWRVSDHTDVLVRFDEAPYKFVFWRGTRVPCWVTENGIWYSNEFFETWDPDMKTGAEPLADKQTRYSHVRIIESHDARVVLHWRYAPVQIDYELAHVDATGWGDWVDEYYTIYPDGTSVRKVNVWTSKAHRTADARSFREWHESIIVNPPGTRAEDNIKTEAVTLADLDGNAQTYSWANGPPGGPQALRPDQQWYETIRANSPNTKWLSKPAYPAIHLVHLKAAYNPYVIVDPKGVLIATLGGYQGNYPSWNHWPVSQIFSYGRYSVTHERPSHSSLTHIYWPPAEQTENRVTWIMLHGMTDKPIAELGPLAKSWISAPNLTINGTGFRSEGYDRTERAYVITRAAQNHSATLEISIRASNQSPIVNPAFLIRNWGSRGVDLKVDGRTVPIGRDFRVGRLHHPEGSDLAIWIRWRSTSPVKLSLSPTRG